MNLESIRSAYRRHSRYYDTVFGPILHPGRKLIVQALHLDSGERVLEVGVGTGLSLPLYPDTVRVTGIDISREMLDIARERVTQDQLTHVDALLEMDAEALHFPDASFDKVVAMYVVSVVPDPVQVVEEMRRVCKPGGELFIVNHFHSQRPIIREVEDLLAPLSKLAGFRPDMDLTEFLRSTDLDVIEKRRANLMGYWKILRCRRAPASRSDSTK
ncbi:Phosphatidylethanolamine N-methyltransferase [Gammaproteobacteria bacterium]